MRNQIRKSSSMAIPVFQSRNTPAQRHEVLPHHPALPEVGLMRQLQELHVSDACYDPASLLKLLVDRPKSPSNGSFKLVPSVPSPTPADLGPAAVKQLMTWGTLDATPRIISKPDDIDMPPPNTPFHLQDISSREAISHKLSSKASKSLRAKAELLGIGQLGRTPGIATPSTRKGDMAPPSWTPRKSDAAGNLTPAARRLLERTTMGAATAKVQRIEETDLNGVRWTPTPSSISRR